jgi:DNA repair exonuclease SbcCD ATPase subunit
MTLSDGENLKNKRVQEAISAIARLTSHNNKLDLLSKKRDELEELMPRLSYLFKSAEREIYTVIDNYSNDKCTIKELEAAKKKYDNAVNAEQRNAKLLNALNTKINHLSSRLSDLKENEVKTEQSVWESLSDEINEDLKKTLSDMILWAYTVNRQRRTPLLYDDFLRTVILSKPNPEDMKRFEPDLKALYQKTLEI